nr:MAG TPA_asm: hypothetical protein [Bacteriophage sp.]
MRNSFIFLGNSILPIFVLTLFGKDSNFSSFFHMDSLYFFEMTRLRHIELYFKI